MQFTFNPDVKWKKYSVNWFLYVIAVVVTMVSTFSNMLELGIIQLIIGLILQLLIILFGITRVMFYYKMPNKVYLRLEENSISLYRPNLLTRIKIEFRNIERVVEMDDMFLLVQDNGKEEHINKAWLTEEAIMMLKKELKFILSERAIFT
ncbi:hypothetical protein [Gracilibacillus saliphilus]|uniref:hypothetical protein n=1 Tax=Gracilibacillus saliphilus TaxID=543890 RepID=UPI0013D4856F|nr:hypothetical protein [Gracilibacillus saliphilus]